jgi:hypothetical protein
MPYTGWAMDMKTRPTKQTTKKTENPTLSLFRTVWDVKIKLESKIASLKPHHLKEFELRTGGLK